MDRDVGAPWELLGALLTTSPRSIRRKSSEMWYSELWKLMFPDVVLSARGVELQKLDLISWLASSPLIFLISGALDLLASYPPPPPSCLWTSKHAIRHLQHMEILPRSHSTSHSTWRARRLPLTKDSPFSPLGPFCAPKSITNLWQTMSWRSVGLYKPIFNSKTDLTSPQNQEFS